MMAKRLQAAPDSVEMLKKRAEFYQNQIQQYQNNPQIGRTLATRAFSGGSAGQPAPQSGNGNGMTIGPSALPTAAPSAM